jgi:hypothetical protein
MRDEGAAPGERPDLERLDFAGLTERDANEVRNAIGRGENFHGYIPSESLGFIIRNYRIFVSKDQARIRSEAELDRLKRRRSIREWCAVSQPARGTHY